MNKWLIPSLSLVVSVPVFCGVGKVSKESITVNREVRTYFLFVPAHLSNSAPPPLIVMLHGSGRDGSSLLQAWTRLASKEGIILVGPNSQNPAGWTAPADGPAFLRHIVEAVKKDHPVNPQRVYLFGHSAGAAFALVMACWESEFFAAASAHAGALRGSSEFAAIAVAKRKIPVQLIVGTRDPFFPVVLVRATRDEFEKKGFPVELKEIRGHDHNYYDFSSAINRDVWRFLSDKKLFPDPR